jgi:signal transduction histidine kinase
LFENLIRNAVEHGGADVTVTVGPLADGIFIADDGPGIPAEKRADVFASGYTSRENGAGLGLAIVATSAKAHGWGINDADSDDGGARFEITGMDIEGKGVSE